MSESVSNTEAYYVDDKVESKDPEQETLNESKQQDEEEEKILAELLEQKKKLNELKQQEEEEENFKREFEQHMEDVKNNINIFLTWSNEHYTEDDFYKNFSKNFSKDYRMALFENICNFFKDENIITDDVLWYWKILIINIIKSHKKYKYYIDNKNEYFDEDFIFDINNRTTNLNIVKEKHILRCFVGENPLCYFKENGNEYYAS